MKLKEIILSAFEFEDTDDHTHQIYAKRINGKFEPASEARMQKLTEDELELKIKEYADTNCPGFDYFLELYILQEFLTDLQNLKEYRSDEAKVNRIIYYAEFDA